jgi:hypothetical protein
VDQLKAEIADATGQRDRRDETSEDKLAIYRHQAANIQRKKAAVAEQLQAAMCVFI